MPSHANLRTGYSSCWFPGDNMSFAFFALYSYEPNKGELLSKMQVYKFEHTTMKGRTCGLWYIFLSWVPRDQGRSETPQFMANNMDIRCLHSAKDHCYLQYSQRYSTSFEMTNSIDNLITTIFCSHTMSTNGSPPKTTIIAPIGGLFGSQQHPGDDVGASDNDAWYAPSKDTQFGQHPNQFPPPQG